MLTLIGTPPSNTFSPVSYNNHTVTVRVTSQSLIDENGNFEMLNLTHTGEYFIEKKMV